MEDVQGLLERERIMEIVNARAFVGSYDYRLSRAGDTWHITHFTFHLKFIDGNSDLDREDAA